MSYYVQMLPYLHMEKWRYFFDIVGTFSNKLVTIFVKPLNYQQKTCNFLKIVLRYLLTTLKDKGMEKAYVYYRENCSYHRFLR